jgi:hypothetical protein
MANAGKGKSSRTEATISITNAQESLSNDQRGRQRRYFISMMVRTLCFIAAVFLHGTYRWIAMGGAVILPYVAVVVANAGRENISGPNAIVKNRYKAINSKSPDGASKNEFTI